MSSSPWLMPVIIGIAVLAIAAIVVIAVISNKPATNQQNGKLCDVSAQCASGYCNDQGVCDDPPCTVSGLPCQNDSNCCAGSHCINGACSQPDSYVAVQNGYNISSSGNAQESGKAQTACQAECTGDCVGYTFFPSDSDPTTGGCSLVKSLPSAPIYTNGTTSYVRKTAGTTLKLPGAFVGQFYTPTPVSGVSACDALCKSAGASCVAYSIDGKNNCYLAPNTTLLGAGSNDPTMTSYVL